MKIMERHPQLIAAAIAATGALFLGASILEFPFLQTEPPGVYFLMALAIVFLFCGSYFLIKANRGQLDPSGKTVTDVRLGAIENMDSAELLSQIAREDPDADVREKALARLEEIAA
jgi:hypothetical protein